MPPGQAIRPTGERAREALFDVLEHGAPPVRGARFLDLFCGTGAVGLEARAEQPVLLIDTTVLRSRWRRPTLPGRAPPGVPLTQRPAVGPAPHRFDLIFLDPPYRSRLADVTLGALARGEWLAGGARVIVELAATEDLDLPVGYTLERERRYGNTKFLFLRHSKELRWQPQALRRLPNP